MRCSRLEETGGIWGRQRSWCIHTASFSPAIVVIISIIVTIVIIFSPATIVIIFIIVTIVIIFSILKVTFLRDTMYVSFFNLDFSRYRLGGYIWGLLKMCGLSEGWPKLVVLTFFFRMSLPLWFDVWSGRWCIGLRCRPLIPPKKVDTTSH